VYLLKLPLFHSLTHKAPDESDQTLRVPEPGVAGSITETDPSGAMAPR
jgi:hypothetical protein